MMTQIFGLTDASDVISVAAVASTLIIAIGGTWAQFRLASGQKKARLADFENENLRELRGHIAHILESNVRKLALTHKFETIAPQGQMPNHPNLVEEFIRTARDRDDIISSSGVAFEHIRLMLIEQTNENVALVAEIRKSLDAKTNDDLLGSPIVPAARSVIESKIKSIRGQLQ